MVAGRPRLAVTIDVEDWPQSSWDRSLPVGDYCADNVRRLLALLGEWPDARATFFVLGKFAERHPDAVREIHAAGHEIACHGYGHEEIFRGDRAAFEADLERATGILSDLVGQRPLGYRAPDFSIVGESLWALDVLAEAGYAYDSSVFPIDKARYGIPTWPVEAGRVRLDNGATIVEFPMTVKEIGGKRRPVSGGGYARLLPAFLLRRFLCSEAKRRAVPPVFYCHPYEIDPGEFRRVPAPIPWKVRLHQGLGRRGFAGKLRMLLREFDVCDFRSVLKEEPSLQDFDYGPYKLEPGTIKRPGIF